MQSEHFGPATGKVVVVVLHGASGPDAYRKTAQQIAAAGYPVLFLHYYDASRGRSPSDANYRAWVGAVADAIQSEVGKGSRIVLVGISLGASVALAAGTQLDEVDSVVDWSGSLPDFYYLHMKRLPPLLILHGALDNNVLVTNAKQLFTLCERMNVTCSGKIYPEGGHVFFGDGHDALDRVKAFLQARAATSGTEVLP